jgi:hypothetical protein
VIGTSQPSFAHRVFIRWTLFDPVMILRIRYTTALTASIIFLALARQVFAETPGYAAGDVGQPAEPQVSMPDAQKIVLLLRTTLLTLNDAIQTGNFTVLRDRGAPGFRDVNSPAKLSQAFADFASKRIDLSAVSVISPQLTEPPGLDQQKGMLHLKGYFPGQPVQINFEVLYQAVRGRWELFGLSVQPSNPTAERKDTAATTSPKKQ